MTRSEPVDSGRFARAVILGASGGVGRLLGGVLDGKVDRILRVDRLAADGQMVDDAEHPSPALADAIRAADLIVLALPDRVAQAAGPAVLRHASRDSLVVDTCSVKGPYADACRDQGTAEMLSINPLFRPDLGLAGHRVALTPLREGRRTACFEKLLTDAGGGTVRVDPTAHDRAAALNQAVVHALLFVFARAAEDASLPSGFLTPPARTLLGAAARMLQGAPELYWAMQSQNPAAAEARGKIIRQLAAFDAMVCAGDARRFEHVWKQALEGLGEPAGDLAREAFDLYSRRDGR